MKRFDGSGTSARDRSLSLRHIPSDWHPEDTLFETWFDALVIQWDLKKSTEKIHRVGAEPTGYLPNECWKAQSEPMCLIPQYLGEDPSDLILPTGDGFFLIYNLERFRYSRKPSFRSLLSTVLSGLVRYQDDRAEYRTKTDAHGVMRSGNFTVYGSRFLDGRFGVARGAIEIRVCGKSELGKWFAPVGEPFFLAARLNQAAPDFGLLVHSSCGWKGKLPLRVARRHLHMSREAVDLKGFDEPQIAWRFSPRA